MERWNPLMNDLEKNLKIIQGYFGKDWLKKESLKLAKKPKKVHNFTHHLASKAHPIAFLYMKAEKNLHDLKRNPEKGLERESLELISFSESLRAVKKIDVVDISGKILPIKTWSKFKDSLKNQKQFKQTAYEIEIGSALKRSNFSTSFIQESEEKTPDILVTQPNEKIYIECKFRQQTQKEIQYDHMFKEFYWRVMQLMYNVGKFYLICIEWMDVPNLKKVKLEIDEIATKIKNNEQGFYETKNAKIWLEKLAEGNQEFQGSFDVNIKKYLSGKNTADIVMPQANVEMFNGKIKHKNPTVVMFRNISFEEEMVKGVLALLNKAYKQIPKKEMGFIFIETRLSFANNEIKQSLTDLENKLKGKLGIIGRVNGIVLTKSYFKQKNIKINDKHGVLITRIVESKGLPNKKPNLKPATELLDKFKHLKYY